MGTTAVIVYYYTRETKRLRQEAQRQVEATQRQIDVSQQQVKTTQEQIEISQRPFVVIDPQWRREHLQTLKLRNIGNSAAINVEVIAGQYRVNVPILESQEMVVVEVCEDDPKMMALELLQTKVLGGPEQEAPREKRIFRLDPTSRSRGLILKIEYCNVAMMQYHTTEKILPTGVIIESSGKMGPYVGTRQSVAQIPSLPTLDR
jgi:hypothetical protein